MKLFRKPYILIKKNYRESKEISIIALVFLAFVALSYYHHQNQVYGYRVPAGGFEMDPRAGETDLQHPPSEWDYSHKSIIE